MGVYGDLEARCGRVDVEEWRSGGLEVWRRTAGAAVWKYRGMERAGALEASCRYGDMEDGDMEIWRRAAGVATWRRGYIEVWSCGGPNGQRGPTLQQA